MAIIGDEYLTSNTHIAYPFKENATGIIWDGPATHGANARITPDFLIDAILVMSQDTSEVYLTRITRINPTLWRFSFFFVKTSGSMPWDYTISMDDIDTSSTPFILTAVGQTFKLFFKFLVGQAFLDYLPGVATEDTFGMTLPFETTALSPNLTQVENFYLAEDETTLITKDVKFKGGYNVALALSDIIEINSTKDIKNITLSAVPGSGLGRVPCDEQPKIDIPPMSLIPDADGDIFIGGDDCISVIPHPETGSIELQGNCTACCGCEDYVRLAEVTRKMLQRANTAYQYLDNIHHGSTAEEDLPYVPYEESFDYMVSYFNTSITPIRCAMHLSAIAKKGVPTRYALKEGGGQIARLGSPNFITLAIRADNHFARTVENVALSVTIGDGEVITSQIVVGEESEDLNEAVTYSTAAFNKNQRLSWYLLIKRNWANRNAAWQAVVTMTFTNPDTGEEAVLTETANVAGDE